MKLFQNKKLNSKLNDLQSFLILSFNPPFLKWRTKFPKNCVREENDFSEKAATKINRGETKIERGVQKPWRKFIFSLLTSIVTHTAFVFQFRKSFLNLFRDGVSKKMLPYLFSIVTSTNIRTSSQNFLVFSFNLFTTLVKHFKAISCASHKLLNLNQEHL